METTRLEPFAEVEGALFVVEVLHAPHPELGGLLLVGREHFCGKHQNFQYIHIASNTNHVPTQDNIQTAFLPDKSPCGVTKETKHSVIRHTQVSVTSDEEKIVQPKHYALIKC